MLSYLYYIYITCYNYTSENIYTRYVAADTCLQAAKVRLFSEISGKEGQKHEDTAQFVNLLPLFSGQNQVEQDGKEEDHSHAVVSKNGLYDGWEDMEKSRSLGKSEAHAER